MKVELITEKWKNKQNKTKHKQNKTKQKTWSGKLFIINCHPQVFAKSDVMFSPRRSLPELQVLYFGYQKSLRVLRLKENGRLPDILVGNFRTQMYTFFISLLSAIGRSICCFVYCLGKFRSCACLYWYRLLRATIDLLKWLFFSTYSWLQPLQFTTRLLQISQK